jgi:hypothetical protein
MTECAFSFWCIIETSPRGVHRVYTESVRSTRREAIETFIGPVGKHTTVAAQWRKKRKMGIRCLRGDLLVFA